MATQLGGANHAPRASVKGGGWRSGVVRVGALGALLAVALQFANGCSADEPSTVQGGAGTGGTAALGGDASAGSIQQNCASADDCVPGDVCHPRTGTCVDCLTDNDCKAGDACIGQQCTESFPCVDNDDCASASGDRVRCDERRGQCVQCFDDAGCLGGWLCEDSKCVAVPSCANSLDCETGTVCRTREGFEVGECVSCIGDADCNGNVCFNNECVPPCVSDINCVAAGSLCDTTLEHCVECLSDTDCADNLHCAAGVCEVDLCRPGSYTCLGSEVGTCSASGAGYEASLCPQGRSCIMNEGQASCVSHLCPPGEIGCDEDRRYTLTCADNGLEIVRTTDCNALGQICADGVCLPVACAPDSLFCIDRASYQCDHTGTASTFVEECGVRQYCDSDTGTCKNQDCAPGQTRCDGNVVVTCDGNGAGSLTTDCEDTDEVCYDGACLPSICTLGDMRCDGNDIIECVANGTAERVVTTCFTAQFCQPPFGVLPPQCVLDICTAGYAACQGNMLGTCNAAGSGLEPGAQSCSGGCFDPNPGSPGGVYCLTAPGDGGVSDAGFLDAGDGG